jgi:hypothetical protein
VSKGLEEIAAARRVLRDRTPTEDPATALEMLLEKHALVLVGGTARIVGWKPRLLYPGDTAEAIELLNEAGFKLYYKHLYILESVPGGGQVRVSIASKFLDQARRYAGLIFAPGEGDVVAGQLNMWRGFGVVPAAGDWSRMQDHIRNVLATGDDMLGEYILDWSAWSVQHPGDRSEVALVVRAKRVAARECLAGPWCGSSARTASTYQIVSI